MATSIFATSSGATYARSPRDFNNDSFVVTTVAAGVNYAAVAAVRGSWMCPSSPPSLPHPMPKHKGLPGLVCLPPVNARRGTVGGSLIGPRKEPAETPADLFWPPVPSPLPGPWDLAMYWQLATKTVHSALLPSIKPSRIRYCWLFWKA